jgi:hypothetical protein
LLSNEVAKGNKIILTTNKFLIKDGVQAIDDNFLEWFVKNPSCEYVKLKSIHGKKWKDYEYYKEWHKDKVPDWAWDYKIIIPKEEPTILEEAKQRAANYMSLKGALEPKDVVLGYKTSLDAQMLNSQYVDFSNPNADKITSTSTTSFKQETIEEAAKRIYGSDVSKDVEYYAFLNGANWQAERMYSEEEVIKIVETSRITGLTAEYLIERFKNLKRYSPHMPIIASNPNKTNQPTTNEENNI